MLVRVWNRVLEGNGMAVRADLRGGEALPTQPEPVRARCGPPGAPNVGEYRL